MEDGLYMNSLYDFNFRMRKIGLMRERYEENFKKRAINLEIVGHRNVNTIFVKVLYKENDDTNIIMANFAILKVHDLEILADICETINDELSDRDIYEIVENYLMMKDNRGVYYD